MSDISREELISLCEHARVPQNRWRNRDSQKAQVQIGEAWALLSAGCAFVVVTGDDLGSDENFWWIQVKSQGFGYFENLCYEEGFNPDDHLKTDLFYIPTQARLDSRKDQDWY